MPPCLKPVQDAPRIDLVRLLASATLAVMFAAVTLGYMAGVPGAGRVAAPARFVAFREPEIPEPGSTVHLLHLAQRKPLRLSLPAGERLDLLGVSPWHDGRGQSQGVGRWWRLDPAGNCREYGLARLGVPGGRILDRVASSISPRTPPCGFPGTAARVLFVGNNESIYGFDFETEGAEGPDKAPRSVTWRKLPRGVADVRVVSLSWPTAPALGGRLLAALCTQPTGESSSRTKSRLWWLELDAVGGEIVAAGPLMTRQEDPRVQELDPVAGRSAAGRLMLAYLQDIPGAAGWRVVVAPLRSDAVTGAPSIAPAEVREVAAECGHLAPDFGAGGQRVPVIPAGFGNSTGLRFLPIDPPGRPDSSPSPAP